MRSGFSRNGSCEVGEGEEGAHESANGEEKEGAVGRNGGELGMSVFSERSEDESLLQGMLG